MSDFRSLNLLPVYVKGRDDIVEDFLIPTLSKAAEYSRAAATSQARSFLCRGLVYARCI
jgi:hypothetical protein